ncbi:hypothetical protein IT407_04720 [Candidatus Uhrbacteria bacterium]|nr:hypothetical protein [Candidatus Uhrbacteria bacterium]
MPKPSAWLFLDTHAPGQSRFAFFEEGKPIKQVQIEGRASALLPRLAKSLKPNLAGVCVVAGPGSFSSVRAGVLQANLIARLLKLPLVGVTVDEALDLDALHAELRDTRLKLSVPYVAPIYDKEPNITVPKPA